ncbi:MAG: GGDEF domain-containing protein [Treponema sp.]|jgi:diguanylate cyclase (GGDEF)-like protein|nr:GGDEF domain-containing protein [Treponema sp.]
MPDGKMPLSPIADPVLIKSPLFAAMSELEFNAVAAFLERRKVKKGERVFREGDVGEEMFIFLSGLLSAFVSQSDGTDRWVFDVKPGDFFGEMSIIANEPRSATISAKIDTEIMVLQGIDFYRIVFEHPMIGLKLLQAIGTVQNQWLDQTSKHLEDLMRWGETARRRAITDEMTGLYNRRFLEESIKDRFEHSSVNLRKMSLMMMDLDKVHEINDKHGSQAGDQVIVTVADILRSIMRSEDIASRLSGDEYAVLLPDTDTAEAVLVAERIRKTIETKEVIVPKSPGAAEKMPIHIRISIGIAVAPTHAKNVESLILAADSVLRSAKDLGRNRVIICT